MSANNTVEIIGTPRNLKLVRGEKWQFLAFEVATRVAQPAPEPKEPKEKQKEEQKGNKQTKNKQEKSSILEETHEIAVWPDQKDPETGENLFLYVKNQLESFIDRAKTIGATPKIHIAGELHTYESNSEGYAKGIKSTKISPSSIRLLYADPTKMDDKSEAIVNGAVSLDAHKTPRNKPEEERKWERIGVRTINDASSYRSRYSYFMLQSEIEQMDAMLDKAGLSGKRGEILKTEGTLTYAKWPANSIGSILHKIPVIIPRQIDKSREENLNRHGFEPKEKFESDETHFRQKHGQTLETHSEERDNRDNIQPSALPPREEKERDSRRNNRDGNRNYISKSLLPPDFSTKDIAEVNKKMIKDEYYAPIGKDHLEMIKEYRYMKLAETLDLPDSFGKYERMLAAKMKFRESAETSAPMPQIATIPEYIVKKQPAPKKKEKASIYAAGNIGKDVASILGKWPRTVREASKSAAEDIAKKQEIATQEMSKEIAKFKSDCGKYIQQYSDLVEKWGEKHTPGLKEYVAAINANAIPPHEIRDILDGRLPSMAGIQSQTAHDAGNLPPQGTEQERKRKLGNDLADYLKDMLPIAEAREKLWTDMCAIADAHFSDRIGYLLSSRNDDSEKEDRVNLWKTYERACGTLIDSMADPPKPQKVIEFERKVEEFLGNLNVCHPDIVQKIIENEIDLETLLWPICETPHAKGDAQPAPEGPAREQIKQLSNDASAEKQEPLKSHPLLHEQKPYNGRVFDHRNLWESNVEMIVLPTEKNHHFPNRQSKEIADIYRIDPKAPNSSTMMLVKPIEIKAGDITIRETEAKRDEPTDGRQSAHYIAHLVLPDGASALGQSAGSLAKTRSDCREAIRQGLETLGHYIKELNIQSVSVPIISAELASDAEPTGLAFDKRELGELIDKTLPRENLLIAYHSTNTPYMQPGFRDAPKQERGLDRQERLKQEHGISNCRSTERDLLRKIHTNIRNSHFALEP
jgi:hypothetical protein